MISAVRYTNTNCIVANIPNMTLHIKQNHSEVISKATIVYKITFSLFKFFHIFPCIQTIPILNIFLFSLSCVVCGENIQSESGIRNIIYCYKYCKLSLLVYRVLYTPPPTIHKGDFKAFRGGFQEISQKDQEKRKIWRMQIKGLDKKASNPLI